MEQEQEIKPTDRPLIMAVRLKTSVSLNIPLLQSITNKKYQYANMHTM